LSTKIPLPHTFYATITFHLPNQLHEEEKELDIRIKAVHASTTQLKRNHPDSCYVTARDIRALPKFSQASGAHLVAVCYPQVCVCVCVFECARVYVCI
jgi:hypothetical protein